VTSAAVPPKVKPTKKLKDNTAGQITEKKNIVKQRNVVEWD
jgi:hypothetical protein